MSKTMNTFERVQRMYEHREADRVPMQDSPWHTTLERWHREGLPENISYVDYFDLDHFESIHVDTSPRFAEEVVEETDEYTIVTTSWGATLKNWKHIASTPEFLDFKINGPESWAAAKERMQPTPDRIPWDHLRKNYKGWRENGAWVIGQFWFGFDVTHSWTVGTERVLTAMALNPEWCMDMFGHFLHMSMTLMDMVWEAGYTFDAISWPDDMGYKYKQFFSLRMYRNLLKPFQKRAIEWAHAKRIKTHLHSCGNIEPFIPELIEIGLDALNPLEVKAGMDTLALKKQYGDQLVLHGGINAVHWDDPEKIMAEMETKLPVLKENGGYIFASDHSIPDAVSLEDFANIVALYKKLGSY
jgi:uroporphyrinogen decarboxylase